MDDKTDILVQKTLRMDAELHDKIQRMADEAERDFSGQVRFMLKEYIRIKEGK